MNPSDVADDALVVSHALELAAALRHVTELDLALLQRLAVAGIRDGIENHDPAFALVWRCLGRCTRAERGRREQAVFDFIDDELDGPGEGCLAEGWAVPSGWVVETDGQEGGGYDAA